MQKTTNLGMNLFESGDPVKAEFFNHNTEVLENHVSKKVSYASGSFAPFSRDSRFTLTFDSKPLFLMLTSLSGFVICIPGCRGISYSQSNYLNTVVNCEWGSSSVTFYINQNETNNTVINGSYPVYYFAVLE